MGRWTRVRGVKADCEESAAGADGDGFESGRAGLELEEDFGGHGEDNYYYDWER